MLHRFLNDLPNLRSISATASFSMPQDIDQDYLKIEHQRPQPIFNLENLDLLLNIDALVVMAHVNTSEWIKAPFSQKWLDFFFSLLGRLEGLKRMSLRSLDNHAGQLLLLKNGYLSRLGNLKQLRELQYGISFSPWYEWGKEEARWILEHWPRLCCMDVLDIQELDAISGDFKEEMLTQKPLMEMRSSFVIYPRSFF
ncbi:hypothetical protein BX616_010077 [Lobosporangium transversale]|nr:hypothetical protein BX616_010077 [Lobosporangium transversale]